MTPAETLVAELGSLAVAGAIIACGREAVKRNWIKISFSFGITTPDGRSARPRQKAATMPAGSADVTAALPADQLLRAS